MPTEFTPVSALLGGTLIGLAATLLYAMLGRIAGVSGLLNTALENADGRSWRIAFLLGLIAGAALWFTYAPGVPPLRTNVSIWWLVVAGLLVGYGTRLGNGCTSGHGICGLARMSKRSVAAVISFMGAGFATVYVIRHMTGGLA